MVLYFNMVNLEKVKYLKPSGTVPDAFKYFTFPKFNIENNYQIHSAVKKRFLKHLYRFYT